MPKYRAVHTKIIQSFDFNEMPDDFTRLMWVMLPLGVDSEGRGIHNASWIRSKIFPLRDDLTNQKIINAMQWYSERGMIEIYEVAGRSYFVVNKFKDYQRVDKESPSVLPAPTPEKVQTNSGKSPDQLAENSSLNANEYSNENANEKSSSPTPSDAEFRAHFGNFNNQREQKRWTAFVESVGFENAQRIADWADKKEIHMTNRTGLMDSLETAAKNWKDNKPPGSKLKGDASTFFEKLNKLRDPEPGVANGNA